MFKWLQDRHRVALENEIKSLRTDINLLASEIEMVRTNISSLRGSFNRKVGKGKTLEIEEGADAQRQDSLPTNPEELREMLRREYGIY